MQIGGAAIYFAPAASSLPARSVTASISHDASAEAASAVASPAAAVQSPPDKTSASGRDETDKASERDGQKPEASPQQQRLQQLEIAELVSRDQEVRAHEQAHAAVGGSYAGAPTYTFTRGPDGKRYAVGGEVSIDAGPIPNNPEATLRKMEIVLRAALAPAEPSVQDLRIAAQAQAQMTQARAELAELRRAEALDASEKRAARTEKEAEPEEESEETSTSARQAAPASPSLDLYRHLNEPAAAVPLVDLLA